MRNIPPASFASFLMLLMSGTVSFFSDSLDGFGHHSNLGFPWRIIDDLYRQHSSSQLYERSRKIRLLDLCLGYFYGQHHFSDEMTSRINCSLYVYISL